MTESQWGNVALVEVVWSLVNLAALLVVIYLWSHVARDRSAQRRHRDHGPRDLIADANMLAESFRLMLALLFVAAGVGAMFTPSPPPDPHFLLARAVTIACLMLGAMVNAAWSLYAGLIRRRLNVFAGDIQFTKPGASATVHVTLAVSDDGLQTTHGVGGDDDGAALTKDEGAG